MGVTRAVVMEGADPLGLLPGPRRGDGTRLSGARWADQIEPRDQTPRRCVRCGWRGQLAFLLWDGGSSDLLCLLCRDDERVLLREMGVRPRTEAPI